MEGAGVAYLVESVCADAEVSFDPPTKVTRSKILSSQYWGQIYNVGIELTYPAGSHDWFQYADHDLTQKCQIAVVTGDAEITFTYTSDQWSDITPNSIETIVVNGKVTVQNGDSKKYDFGQLHYAFGASEKKYTNITQWISQGIQILFANATLENPNSQGVAAAPLLWAQDAAGLYNPSLTWQGMAVAVAIVCHYVLDMSDGTETGLCPYKGVAGEGMITAPSWISTTLLVVLICSITMEVLVVSSWLLVVGGGEHIDRCVQMIDDPLRTLYYMRGSAAQVVSKIAGNDIGHISLLKHLEKVHVRFGEDKSTRGNDFGTLILDEPSKVVKIAKNRKIS
ncbi:hypothetical protein HDU98_010996 [Podochytrium sp. JEL0797]|nr:hypothetical protein HDU98_010996 [Podochytrium sp. JEL0797]